MSQPIFVLNGPNLNLLGLREPGIYGGATLETIAALCAEAGQRVGRGITFRQSNHEGVLVDWIHEAMTAAGGIVINPGAYTHTSVALHDAVRAVGLPVVEVHISNIHAREAFRHHSYLSPVVKGVIAGFGPHGYIMGIEAIARMLED
jgi:3-dehydroquinate dehydratase-2